MKLGRECVEVEAYTEVINAQFVAALFFFIKTFTGELNAKDP